MGWTTLHVSVIHVQYQFFVRYNCICFEGLHRFIVRSFFHSKNVVYNYTDAEVKVRESTSNDPWGPSSSLLAELAEYTFHM